MPNPYSISSIEAKLRAENTALRRKLDAYESGHGIDKLKEKYEAEIRKRDNKILRIQKESDRYQELWTGAIRRARLLVPIEDTIASDDLKKENAELKTQVLKLKAQLQEANDTIARLKAQMNRDHENSSLPSSQKPFHKKIKNSRVRTGRRPGAQHGHAGHPRPHMAPTEPVITIPVPQKILDDPDYYLTGKMVTKQLIDFEFSIRITQYETPEFRSRSTGKRGHAGFPSGLVNEFNYGPNVKAFAFLLTDCCNISIDKAQELIEGLSNGNIRLSKGMIAGLRRQFSDLTEKDRERIYTSLLKAPSMHADFTPGRLNGKGFQVLLCANEDEMLYSYREHKGLEGIKGTPAGEYQQTLIHDHDVSFYHFAAQHQECLSHVLRYLQDSIENEPELTWNRQMKEFLSRMIHEVKHRRKELTQDEISSYETGYDEILRIGDREYREHPPNKYYPDGRNLHLRMTKYRDNHLLFLRHPEIDYTNNLAERGLRKFKRKMKQAVTFRSAESAKGLCNCMSFIQTQRIQGANLFRVSREVFTPG